MVAAIFGISLYVKFLLDCSLIDVNACTNFRSSPLMYTAKGGFNNIVELLLRASASTALLTKEEGTLLF